MVIGQSSKIIGTPIRIENLEVAQYDFPNEMYWNEVEKACADLGSGWRLPTKDELNLIYLKRYKIGGFGNGYYWSSTVYNKISMWGQGFYAGNCTGLTKDAASHNVRAVRSF